MQNTFRNRRASDKLVDLVSEESRVLSDYPGNVNCEVGGGNPPTSTRLLDPRLQGVSVNLRNREVYQVLNFVLYH